MSTTGKAAEPARKIANLLNIRMQMEMGIQVKPKNEEEAVYIQQIQQEMMQAAQNPPQDPSMKLAEAEVLKGQADIMEQQNRAAEIQLKAADTENKARETESKIDLNITQGIKNLADAQSKGVQNVLQHAKTFSDLSNIQ